MTSGFNFREDVTDDLKFETELKAIHYNTGSDFQKIQIIETAAFGRTLILDGKTQSSQVDEFAYHESLVQTPMLAVGWALNQSNHGEHQARRAYIGGGGELATARELLKHKTLEEVVMVDLDKVVVDTSVNHLPEWSAGATKDPRLKLHYTDAYAWLNRSDEETGTFDIIIMDICDPVEAGPGIVLYTKEFYEMAKTKLRPGGVLVTQSGPAGLLNHKECFTTIHNTLKSVFEHVLPYHTEVPSFGSPWGFNLAFDASGVPGSALSAEQAKNAGDAFAELTKAEVDARIEARVGAKHLRFYQGTAHRGMFGFGKHVTTSLAEEDRIITKATPVFMH